MRKVAVLLLFAILLTPANTSGISTRGVSVQATTIYLYKGQNLSLTITLYPENETKYEINISVPSGIEVYPGHATLTINETTEFHYYLYTNESYLNSQITIRVHENYSDAEGNAVERYYVFNVPLVVGDAYAIRVTTLSTVFHVPVTKNIKVTPLETNYTVPVQVKETPATFYLPEGYYRFEATDGSGGVDLYVAGSTSIVILCFSLLDYVIIIVTATLIAVSIYIIVKRYRTETIVTG